MRIELSIDDDYTTVGCRFVWLSVRDGAVSMTPAQLSMLLEGIDWRMPARTFDPRIGQPDMAG